MWGNNAPPKAIDYVIKSLVPNMGNVSSNRWSGQSKGLHILPLVAFQKFKQINKNRKQAIHAIKHQGLEGWLSTIIKVTCCFAGHWFGSQ